MTGVPPPGYPDQSLPQSKGGDIVALFLPLKGEIPGIELVCWSGSRLECVPSRIFCRRPGTWIDRGWNLSVLCLSDCEEANKPKCFIRVLPAPSTCQSGFISLSDGTSWTFTEMRLWSNQLISSSAYIWIENVCMWLAFFTSELKL